jgi:hypothetical protein
MGMDDPRYDGADHGPAGRSGSRLRGPEVPAIEPEEREIAMRMADGEPVA